jgi:perosamine synthetase
MSPKDLKKDQPANEDIPITRPLFGQRERELIGRCLDSGWVAQGPMVERFEQMCGQFCGLPHGVAVSSATTGLHMCLAALGVGPGDEVIIPAFSFVATANAVEYTGAKPVFVDIDLSSFNLTAQAVASAVTSKTKAVLPVSLFGLAVDTGSIREALDNRGIPVVEDAACALGAFINGRHCGHQSDAAVLSFHPRKIITTGEGGMILCRDPGLAEDLRQLRNHGMLPVCNIDLFGLDPSLPQVDRLGYNYRLTDLQGAIGVAQMEKLEHILEARRDIARTYNGQLSNQPNLILPSEPEEKIHAYQSYVILWTNGESLEIDMLESIIQSRNRVFKNWDDMPIRLMHVFGKIIFASPGQGRPQAAPMGQGLDRDWQI